MVAVVPVNITSKTRNLGVTMDAMTSPYPAISMIFAKKLSPLSTLLAGSIYLPTHSSDW